MFGFFTELFRALGDLLSASKKRPPPAPPPPRDDHEDVDREIDNLIDEGKL